MNILYVDYPHNLSESNTFRYYGDLYRQLEKDNNVVVIPPASLNIDHLDKAMADCIIFGLGYFTQNNLSAYSLNHSLRDANTIKVAMLHKLGHNLEKKVDFCASNKFDLIMDPHNTYDNHAKIAKCKAFRFWFNADPEIFHERSEEKIYDIGFSGASHPDGKEQTKNSPTNNLRNRMFEHISKNDYNLYWNMDPTDKNHERIHSPREYARMINKAKIWMATTGPFLDVGPRYFEVMMSKTLLFCNNMPAEYENIFIDGENCVTFENDLSDLDDKIKFYLNNEDERNKIIESAYEFVMNNHTVKNMSDKLIAKITEIKHEKEKL